MCLGPDPCLPFSLDEGVLLGTLNLMARWAREHGGYFGLNNYFIVYGQVFGLCQCQGASQELLLKRCVVICQEKNGLAPKIKGLLTAILLFGLAKDSTQHCNLPHILQAPLNLMYHKNLA